MTAILEGFPGVEIGIYNFMQKDSWLEWVYEKTGIRPYSGAPSTDPFGPRVDIDFWDGMTSVEGYSAIRQWNSVFAKSWHLGNAPGSKLRWENAMRADVSSTAELLSREFENWDYAAARYHSSPFTWINAGPLEGLHGDALPPSYVQTQLTAVRKFGMGGGFGNFHYGGGLKPSWYAPYADAIRSAASPGSVDATAPTLHAGSHCREDPGNGARQPCGLARPLAGQPGRKGCRRAGLPDHRGGNAPHQGLANGLEDPEKRRDQRRALGEGGRLRHQAELLGACSSVAAPVASPSP